MPKLTNAVLLVKIYGAAIICYRLNLTNAFNNFCHAGEVSHLDRGDVKFGSLQSLQLMVHHWWLHLRTNFDSSHQKVLTFPVWHRAPTDPTEEVMILILRKAPIDLLWSKKHNVSNRPLLGQKFHVTCKVPNLLLRCLNAIQCSWSRIWYMGLSVETC